MNEELQKANKDLIEKLLDVKEELVALREQMQATQNAVNIVLAHSHVQNLLESKNHLYGRND